MSRIFYFTQMILQFILLPVNL